MTAPHPRFEVVIGLEVHTHLKTDSKLFSPAPVRYGEAPNHCVHEIDLALPGVLPMLNDRAVELAIRAALATHCSVQRHSIFARKNYFYPDLPKGYQISQYEEPIATGGWIEIAVDGEDGEPRTKRVRLTRIHMEEDAGKSIHDDALTGGQGSLVDLNRAGVPLLEIVSEPDLRSPEEASAYLRALREILRRQEISDADMEKGQFRCDANVSLREQGAEQLGTRTELKNLNSFRFVEEALHAEIERQASLLEEGGTVRQATLGYDAARGRTFVMRLKENADDYRYFPDPDLIPLVLAPERIEAIRATVKEPHEQERVRYETEYGLHRSSAEFVTSTGTRAETFREMTATGAGPEESVKFMRHFDNLIGPEKLTPTVAGTLVKLIEQSIVTQQTGSALAHEIAAHGGDPVTLVRERGLEAVSDSGLLERVADEVLAGNTAMVERFRAGDEKVLNFLMGQVMKKTAGKANAAQVRELLLRKIGTGG